MLPLITLLACGQPTEPSPPPPPDRPPALPTDAVEVHTDGRELRVGDRVVGPTADLLADPVQGLHDPLIEALRGTERAWVHVDRDTPWMLVRKLVNSAHEAGAEVWLGTDTHAWPPSRPTRSEWGRPTCAPGSEVVVGVDRALTLEIHRSADGSWLLASVRFRPLVQRGEVEIPVDELPVSCWSGASCALLDAVARAACEAPPAEAPARVEVAGPVGCVAPLAKAPDDVSTWTTALADRLTTWGITAEDDVVLVPEANVPLAAIAAVYDAFGSLGQPPPTLGRPLVEGNDGAPICDVPVRDRAAIDRAAGAWLGRSLALEDHAD